MALNKTGNVEEIPQLTENSNLILGTTAVETTCGFSPAKSAIGLADAPQSRDGPAPASHEVAGPSSAPHVAQRPHQQVPSVARPVRMARRTRARKNHLLDRFFKTQEEHNSILRELDNELKEIKNILKKQQHTVKLSESEKVTC